MLKLRPRTRFDLLKPSGHSKYVKGSTDGAPCVKKLFKLNEAIYVKDRNTKLWQKGKIIKILSYCTYLVQVGSRIKFVHADSLRSDMSNNNVTINNDLRSVNSENESVLNTNVSESSVSPSASPSLVSTASDLPQPSVLSHYCNKEPYAKSESPEIEKPEVIPTSETPKVSRFGRAL